MTRRRLSTLVALACVAWTGEALGQTPTTLTLEDRLGRLLDSAMVHVQRGNLVHAQVFADEITTLIHLSSGDQERESIQDFLERALFLTASIQSGRDSVWLRAAPNYPPISSGEAEILDQIAVGTDLLLRAQDTIARQTADVLFNRVFTQPGQRVFGEAPRFVADVRPELQAQILELYAASLYPEFPGVAREEGWLASLDGRRRIDSVRIFLEQIVRIDPNWTLSPLLAWDDDSLPGLTDFFQEARDSTFGMSARRLYQPSGGESTARSWSDSRSEFLLRPDSIAIGEDRGVIWGSRRGVITVQSNDSSVFVLHAVRRDAVSDTIVIDSTEIRSDRNVLYIDFWQGYRGDPRVPTPRLSDGAHTFIVTATSERGSLRRCFDVDVARTRAMPPLDTIIPRGDALDADLVDAWGAGELNRWRQSLDPDDQLTNWRMLFQPGAQQPSRVVTALRGVGLGLSAVLIANVFRNGDIKNVVPSDDRARFISGAVVFGSLAAALTEQPIRNDENIRLNQNVRRDFAESVYERWSANATLIREFFEPTMNIGGVRSCDTDVGGS